MRSRALTALACLILFATGPMGAAHTTLATPSEPAIIAAQAPTAPATGMGIVAVDGSATGFGRSDLAVWAGSAPFALPGTSVRNFVMRGPRDASDARAAGFFEALSNCDYVFTDDGFVGSCWSTSTLTNDDGSWQGTGSSTVSWSAANPMAQSIVEDFVLVGRGAYEGLVHRGRSECEGGPAERFDCTWSGWIEPAFTPAEIEADWATRTTRWTGTWRPTEVEDAGEARVSTFDGRCERHAFALHHAVSEGFDTFLGQVSATTSHCWYRTFTSHGSGTLHVADGSTLTFSYQGVMQGLDENGYWRRSPITITGGTGRFTGAAGAGLEWGSITNLEAVTSGAEIASEWMELHLIVRPSMSTTDP